MKEEMRKRLLAMKITEWEGIPYVKDLQCPTCHKTGDGYEHIPGEGYVPMRRSNVIGWCDTPHGLMKAFECPLCFTKYRYHGDTTGRWDLETFLIGLELDVMLQEP